MSWISRYPIEAQMMYEDMVEAGFDEDFIVESIKEMFEPEDEDAE